MSASTEPNHSQRARLVRMHHELRTPLHAIIGYSEILIEEAASEGREILLPDLERILSAGTRLLSMVNELLDPSRGTAVNTADESFCSAVRHNLRTPLNHILGYCEMLLEESVDQGWEDLLPELDRIATSGRELLALLDQLFAFVAPNDGDAVSRSGTDSLVAQVTTTLDIPLPPAADLRSSGRGHVMVVDDNETNRDLLTRWLVREGYTVCTAVNGVQALSLLETTPCDLLLLDVMMPELNGFEVLQRIKFDPALRHLPVLMVSALTELDAVVRCIALGAEDYLTKPFNPILLRARVGACLEKKRLRDREVIHLQEIEQERQRADALLHVIFPGPIVQELKSTGTIKPQFYENVGVLFCDVVDFTPYCERSDPEEVIANLQQLMEAFEDLVEHHGLLKTKTVGDSFMATAGLLEPVDQPALRCVECGFQMVEVAQTLPMSWNVRVGIHIGSVVAGKVGNRRYLFDLWGDTVNTASRVESHGAEGCVNVSATVWRQIADRYEGESHGKVVVKGKGAMELYRVVGLRKTSGAAA